MTDRGLIELAAKAAKRAGMNLLSQDGFYRDCTGFHPMQNIIPTRLWNPLNDDGDALRLAVTLNIEIHLDLSVGSVVTAFMIGKYGHNTFEEVEDNDNCPFKTTRKAIVTAAAEIGKSMEKSQ